jgi:plastocyanin
MGKPGKIAFPVILVLGAITGYITYTFFAAAIPDENIDSPYYQPLSPGSSGNVPGDTGGAAQQQGGGAAQQQGGQTTGAGGGDGSSSAAPAPAGGAGGAATINILEGSSIQGNPDYDPDEITVSAGAGVTVVNQDTVLHTVTSGTGTSDPQSAQVFDSGFIGPGQSGTLSLAQVTPGQYDYYCMVHPYMTGKLVVQ